MSKREKMYLFSLNQQDWTKRSDSENHLNMWTLNVMKATVIKNPDTIYRFPAITPARTAAANLVSSSACERNAAVWDSFISRVMMTWQQVTGVLQKYSANRRHICQTLHCDLWKTISFSDPEPAEWWSPVYVCQDCTLQRSLRRLWLTQLHQCQHDVGLSTRKCWHVGFSLKEPPISEFLVTALCHIKSKYSLTTCRQTILTLTYQ